VLTLTDEKQKDGEEAPPISLELARVILPDGNTSRVVRFIKGSADLLDLEANGTDAERPCQKSSLIGGCQVRAVVDRY
jgi:hypothetical protein